VQQILIVAISLHVLAAISWAGSTFALARLAGHGGERLFVPQIATAALAILSGGYLWRTLHQGVFETMEKVLGVGVVSALVALALQVFIGGFAFWNLRRQRGDSNAQRSRFALAQRLAALLLAVAAVSMAAARFA